MTDFDGVFKYNTEEGSVTVFFTYLLLAFMTLILCLTVLNLLLATIISDHTERANEVTLSHLIFMAKYAIYLDFICCLVRRCLPKFARWIEGHIDIPKTQYSVRYCSLPYCPWDKKKRGGNTSFLCCCTPTKTTQETPTTITRQTPTTSQGAHMTTTQETPTSSTQKECVHGQPFGPHFEWVLEALAAGPDLKTQLKEWLRENRRKEEVAWEEMEEILDGANSGRSVERESGLAPTRSQSTLLVG